MRFSLFGQKLSRDAGIISLMDDLGSALRENPEMIFMGGGNPARVPAMEAFFEQALHQVLDDPEEKLRLLGIYQPPAGDSALLDDLASMLRREYGWQITRDHIALANGSQSAFFVLFNLFGGTDAEGNFLRIQLPMTPEYLGYNEQGIEEKLFISSRPEIELLDNQFFKYHVDFKQLEVHPDAGALCVSRPTNPTGNVISDRELDGLQALAAQQQIPLIVDGAYGTPFPNIMFVDAAASWNENMILVLSLSKLGLPGARTGIVIARPDIIQAFARANTIVSLAPGNMGAAFMKQLIAGDQLLSLSRNTVQPFYQARMQQAVSIFKTALAGLPYRLHQPEGAIFLWLWFEGLPIDSDALYQRLKQRGVLVVSGHHFFPGLEQPWSHRQQCIRITYCQDNEKLVAGANIIAQEVQKAFQG